MTSTSADRTGHGRPLGSYPTYEEAQRVVDRLADLKFPVEHVTVLGRDLTLVEHVVGRLTIGRAALAGMATGVWFGLFLGLVFWIVSPWAPGAVLAAVLLGAAFGAVWGAIAHAMTRGRRDFASVQGLDARSFDVIVDEEYFDEAMRLLQAPAPATT
ncbi:MAG: hypothetical protein QOI54_2573 [Actinomycetota bacterium]|nr:hypothetical protein [Actinomycetota bacterium]